MWQFTATAAISRKCDNLPQMQQFTTTAAIRSNCGILSQLRRFNTTAAIQRNCSDSTQMHQFIAIGNSPQLVKCITAASDFPRLEID